MTIIISWSPTLKLVLWQHLLCDTNIYNFYSPLVSCLQLEGQVLNANMEKVSRSVNSQQAHIYKHTHTFSCPLFHSELC